MIHHHNMYYTTPLLILGLLTGALASCPQGWVAPTAGDGLRCFRFETSGLNWYSARRMCQSAHGELLSIRTQDEQDWIHEEVLAQTKKVQTPVWHWWAGLNAINQPKDWSWSDGSVIDGSLIHWQPNEPDMVDNDEKCGELHKDGFNDNNCNTVFPYICARDADIPNEPCPFGQVLDGRSCVAFNPSPVTTTRAPLRPTPGQEPLQGACAEGWVESASVPNLCFRLEKQIATWVEAKEVCSLAKGSLVSITTEAERTWIEGQVRRLGQPESGWFGMFGFRAEPLPSWWTGLHRLKIGMPWKWEDETTAVDSMLRWHEGEPNNIHWNRNCGQLHLTGFFSTDCDEKYPFICSRPKVYTVSPNECPFGHRRVGGVCSRYPYTHTPLSTTASTTTPRPTRPIEGITAAPEPQQGACPAGWVESATVIDKCYRVETQRKETWENAQKVCQSARGDLVTFSNQIEKEWVFSQVKRVRASMWGGLRTSATQTWTWVDGTPVVEAWWQPEEPNNDFEKCGEIHPRGTNDNSCWRKFGFICARRKGVNDAIQCPFGEVLMGRLCEPLQLPTPPPLNQGACAEGWVESAVAPSTCYRFVQDGESFDDAKKMCRVAHGDLVNVKSPIEKEWLRAQVDGYARQHAKGTWYTGLKKDGDRWTWADSTQLQVETSPNAFGRLLGTNSYDGCGAMSPDGFMKVGCWANNPYICARNKVLPSTIHQCPWGEAWENTSCKKYELHDHTTRVDYVNNIDISRVEDQMRALEGRHDRELAALRQTFETRMSNLTERVQALEAALRLRKPTNRPVIDFDAALTVVASHVPQTDDEDALQVARRLVTDGLGLPEVQIRHARRVGGSTLHPGHLKMEFNTAEGRQMALDAKHKLRKVPNYSSVRLKSAHMRRPNPTFNSM